jgi:hypothetical protein
MSYCCNRHNNKNKRTITNIPDKSRYKKRARLPDEKQNNTIWGHPVVYYKKVMYSIVPAFKIGCQWKNLRPREYGSSSTIHRQLPMDGSVRYFKKDMDGVIKRI